MDTPVMRNVHYEIIKWLDIQTLGRVAQINRYWMSLTDISSHVSLAEKSRRMRCLQLRRSNPLWETNDININRETISAIAHYTVTFDIIIGHHINWNWPGLTCNPNITMDMILDLMSRPKLAIPKNTQFVLSRPTKLNPAPITFDDMISLCIDIQRSINAMTVADYRRYKDQIDFAEFMQHGNITVDDINNSPDLPWDVHDLIHNCNIPLQFIYDTYNNDYLMNVTTRWIFCDEYHKYLLQNVLPAILSTDVDPNMRANQPPVEYAVSMANVLQHPQVDWNWYLLSLSKNITYTERFQNRHIPWVVYWRLMVVNIRDFDDPSAIYLFMADRGELTTQHVISNPDVNWNYLRLYEKNIIDFRIFIKMSDPHLGRHELLRVTDDYVVNNPDIDWSVLQFYNIVMRDDTTRVIIRSAYGYISTYMSIK